MHAILLVLALVVVGFGAISLSEATMGVGTIAIGCFLAIAARLAQAEVHHRALLASKA